MKPSLTRRLEIMAAYVQAGTYDQGEIVKILREARERIHQLETADPLARFDTWDGETPLGPTYDERPGWSGEIRPTQRVLGLNHAWTTSTSLGSGAPGAYIKLGVRAAGEETHRVLDLVAHAEVARELGIGLYGAAERAPLDEAASDLWDQL